METDDIFDSRDYKDCSSDYTESYTYREGSFDKFVGNKFVKKCISGLLWFVGAVLLFVVIVMCIVLIALCFQLLGDIWMMMFHHSSSYSDYR